MSRKLHWDQVYATKAEPEVSWFQATPDCSLRLISDARLGHDARILDVGGGASRLVDHLLAAGYEDVAVLDISEGGLQRAKDRLGSDAQRIEWIVSDVTRFESDQAWDLWHDRAVFHFLVDEADRRDYRRALGRALAPEGHVIIATFGPAGPTRCSGLPTERYSAVTLNEALGAEFVLRGSEIEHHRTPSGATQEFLYCWFQRRA